MRTNYDDIFAEMDQYAAGLRGRAPHGISSEELGPAGRVALRKVQPPDVIQAKGILDGDTHNIGRSVEVVDDGSGLPVGILDLDGDDARGEIATITLFGQAPTGLATPSGVLPATELVVVVDHGAGGFRTSAEFDYVRGMSFKVTGSSIRVAIRADHITGAFGTVFTIGAFAVVGSYSRTSRIIKSIKASAAGFAKVPANATEFQFVRFDSTLAGVVQAQNAKGDVIERESLVANVPCPIIALASLPSFVKSDDGAGNAGPAGRFLFTIEL